MNRLTAGVGQAGFSGQGLIGLLIETIAKTAADKQRHDFSHHQMGSKPFPQTLHCRCRLFLGQDPDSQSQAVGHMAVFLRRVPLHEASGILAPKGPHNALFHGFRPLFELAEPLKVIQRFGEQGAFVKRIVHHDVVIRKFSHVIQFVIPQALRGGIPLKKQAVSLYERP